MAKRKRTTPTDDGFAPIPTANIPRDPTTLAKIGEGTLDALRAYEQDVAATEAKNAIAEAGKQKRRAVTRSDIAAVGHRLNEAAYSLLAIRRLAIDGVENDQEGWYSVAIQELARSTFKGIDACIQRLQPGLGIGNFASEFDRD